MKRDIRHEFQCWMREVNHELTRQCGMSYSDLPDFNYRDAFDDEADPVEIAHEILEREGFVIREDDEIECAAV